MTDDLATLFWAFGPILWIAGVACVWRDIEPENTGEEISIILAWPVWALAMLYMSARWRMRGKDK